MKIHRPRTIAMIAAFSIHTSLSGDALLLLQEASTSEDTSVTDAPIAENKPGFRVVDYRPSGGFVHEFGADLSGGGSVSVDRAFAAFKVGFEAGENVTGSIGVAWGGDWYDFDGTSHFWSGPAIAS